MIVGVVLFGWTLSAFAQCTKDTDCRLDRICEQGRCVWAPFKKDDGPKPPPATSKAPLSAADLAEVFLVCARSPEPGPVFARLRNEGFIGAARSPMADGVPEYVVTKPLTIFGFRVREVSGWQDFVPPSPFFARGPGTAPPTFLAAVVEGEPERVHSAVRARLRERLQSTEFSDEQRRAIEARAAFTVRKRGPLTEVYCGHDYDKHGPLPDPRR